MSDQRRDPGFPAAGAAARSLEDDGGPWRDRVAAFRAGALVILLDGPEVAAIALARATFDPRSAGLIGPHVTLTPPFRRAPGAEELEALRAIASPRLPITLRVGGVGRFPGTGIVYLSVDPAASLRSLRGELVATGLFEPDPRDIAGFEPHVTIAEFGEDPDGAERAATSIETVETTCRSIAWVTPERSARFLPRAFLGATGHAHQDVLDG